MAKSFYETIIASGGFAGEHFDIAQGLANVDIIDTLLNAGDGTLQINTPIAICSTGVLGAARVLNLNNIEQDGRIVFVSIRNSDIIINNLTITATTDINGVGPNLVINDARDYIFVHTTGGSWRAYLQDTASASESTVGFNYVFVDSPTEGDPGVGQLSFDTDTSGNIIGINIDPIDNDNNDLIEYFRNIDPFGIISIISYGSKIVFRYFDVVESTGYFLFDVIELIRSGSDFSNLDQITIFIDTAFDGPQDFGTLLTDPVGASDGDKYYNTTIDMAMQYDEARGKWLSIDSNAFHFSRISNTAVGSYYMIGSVTMTANIGYIMPHNGTIIAIMYTRSDVDAATFEIEEDGVSRSTLISAATSGNDSTKNNDFSANSILSVKNQAGGNTTSNVSGWFKVKWRA